jgi:hypothetical protein
MNISSREMKWLISLEAYLALGQGQYAHSIDHHVDRTNMVCHKSAVAISNMIMAAACYPEAQRRVQEELDMVFEKDRCKCQRFDRRFDSRECLTTLD